MLKDLQAYPNAEFIEILVDVDAMFAAHVDIETNVGFADCPVYAENGVRVGHQPIIEGEQGTPSHVLIDDTGYLGYRFKANSELGSELGYEYFQPSLFSKQFPVFFAEISAYLLRDHGITWENLKFETFNRFEQKPALIEWANESLNHGRKMRVAVALEEEGELKDGFYERADDYGMF